MQGLYIYDISPRAPAQVFAYSAEIEEGESGVVLSCFIFLHFPRRTPPPTPPHFPFPPSPTPPPSPPSSHLGKFKPLFLSCSDMCGPEIPMRSLFLYCLKDDGRRLESWRGGGKIISREIVMRGRWVAKREMGG